MISIVWKIPGTVRGLNPKCISSGHLGHYIGCVNHYCTPYILHLYKEDGVIWGLSQICGQTRCMRK